MTSTSLPIFGQGSQPAEEDGAELDYLAMPEEMATYRMPQLSVNLTSPALAPAKAVTDQLLHALRRFPQATGTIDLAGLDDTNRGFIDELLGEGEVSVLGGDGLRIQESVLAGVWRVRRLDGQNRLLADALEVGVMPRALTESAFAGAATQIDTTISDLPDGVMNALPLLAELNAKIADFRPGAEPHVINLSLLPQTEQDLALLDQRLGKGPVTILSRGYGNCRIDATATRNVWWVRYFNSQDTLILNTLEVSDVPNVACASAEDIADSLQRLQEILQVYA
ncbi:hydrogenase expression protein HupH [Methylomonas koyamae]|uniref:Hydrogenase expression protein HupH n=1 Tax=Methylomonas koyamae TaxID=702114 RepID=A0A177NNX6_9GAMM|nr:hydrogenase expression/formation protein [Methylomonas koyamae]OAI19043.1 hydrogenase expression protein HupH [Methylomonas koyamae]